MQRSKDYLNEQMSFRKHFWLLKNILNKYFPSVIVKNDISWKLNQVAELISLNRIQIKGVEHNDVIQLFTVDSVLPPRQYTAPTQQTRADGCRRQMWRDVTLSRAWKSTKRHNGVALILPYSLLSRAFHFDGKQFSFLFRCASESVLMSRSVFRSRYIKICSSFHIFKSQQGWKLFFKPCLSENFYSFSANRSTLTLISMTRILRNLRKNSTFLLITSHLLYL